MNDHILLKIYQKDQNEFWINDNKKYFHVRRYNFDINNR